MTYYKYIDLLWAFRGLKYNFKAEYTLGGRLCYVTRRNTLNYKNTRRARTYKGHFNVFKHLYKYNN